MHLCEAENASLAGYVPGRTADMIIWKIVAIIRQNSCGGASTVWSNGSCCIGFSRTARVRFLQDTF
jgi:hypothetical protein